MAQTGAGSRTRRGGEPAPAIPGDTPGPATARARVSAARPARARRVLAHPPPGVPPRCRPLHQPRPRRSRAAQDRIAGTRAPAPAETSVVAAHAPRAQPARAAQSAGAAGSRTPDHATKWPGGGIGGSSDPVSRQPRPSALSRDLRPRGTRYGGRPEPGGHRVPPRRGGSTNDTLIAERPNRNTSTPGQAGRERPATALACAPIGPRLSRRNRDGLSLSTSRHFPRLPCADRILRPTSRRMPCGQVRTAARIRPMIPPVTAVGAFRVIAVRDLRVITVPRTPLA